MFGRKRKKTRSRRIIRSEPPEKPLKPAKAIEMIIKMREKADITYSQLARLARVDKSYLRRLELGESRHPGRQTLIDLSEALVDYTKMFDERDVDRVLKAAGFAPAPLRVLKAPTHPWYSRSTDWTF